MILLDTNAILWIYADDARFGPGAREALTRSTRVFYSSVSVSEIAIKNVNGRIALPGGERFPAIFDDMGLTELPFTARHADAIRQEPDLARHDPFDRMIVAQARAEGADLLTSDSVLLSLGYGWIRDVRL